MTLQVTLKFFAIALLASTAVTADISDNSIDNTNVSTTKQYQNSYGTTGYPGNNNGYNPNNPGYNNGRPNNNGYGNNGNQFQPTGVGSYPNGNGLGNNGYNTPGYGNSNNGYGNNNNGYNTPSYGNNNNNNNNNGYNNGNRNRRTFQSAREWNNDFMARYQKAVSQIPQQAYDAYQQNQINAARRWAAGLQNNYNSRSDYYLNQSNRQGEMHMQQKENNLNTFGHTYFPLTWSSQQCGTNGYWRECGQFTN